METSKYCPNCEFASEIEFSECPKCGIILEKFHIVKEKTTEVPKEQNDQDIA